MAIQAPPFKTVYQALLLTPEWRKKRERILSRDQHQCRNCGRAENLHVHHRQYHFLKEIEDFQKPWLYNDNLLITLCNRCHVAGHIKYDIPTIYK